MNKTPMKSFEIIKEMYEYFVKKSRDLEPKLMICEKEDFDNVETALKDLLWYKEQLEDFGIKENQLRQAFIVYKNYQADEKKLKALKIIKEKQVNVGDFVFYQSINKVNDMILPQETIIDLCYSSAKNGYLTQEEYDLLKEVLL